MILRPVRPAVPYRAPNHEVAVGLNGTECGVQQLLMNHVLDDFFHHRFTQVLRLIYPGSCWVESTIGVDPDHLAVVQSAG